MTKETCKLLFASVLLASCGSSSDPSTAGDGGTTDSGSGQNQPTFGCTGVADSCDQGAFLVLPDCEALPQCDPLRSCRLESLSCFGYTLPSTCTSAGCSWEGECSGTPRDCSRYQSRVSCEAQRDCTWYSALNECDGFRSCLTQTSATNCAAIEGCRWQEQCRGVANADACNDAGDTQATCEASTGCAWSYIDCRGNEFACARHESQPACQAEAGCTWTLVP